MAQLGDLTRHYQALHTTAGMLRQKKHETRIAKCLDKAGIEYTREHYVDFKCVGDMDGKYARIDFLILLGNTIVFLEVDEKQHRFGEYSIKCDLKRMANIMESLSLAGNQLPVVFLRYNPDAFKVAGTTRKTRKHVRERKLVSLLQNPTSGLLGECEAKLSIKYLNYDQDERGKPIILDAADYNEEFVKCVII